MGVLCDANASMLPHAPPSPAPSKAPPTGGGENAGLSSPPAPPKKHVPTYVDAKDDDGVLTFGRLDGKAAVEGQSLQDAFKHFQFSLIQVVSPKTNPLCRVFCFFFFFFFFFLALSGP